MCLGWAANTSTTGSSSHSGAASIAAASSSRSVRKHAAGQVDSDSEDDFDRECAQLINSELLSEWKQELRAYLKDPALTVTKDCDTIEWWPVCPFVCPLLVHSLTYHAEIQLPVSDSRSNGPQCPSHPCVLGCC